MTLDTYKPLTDTNGHVFCWFCHPEQYPAMPIGFTLCARCGTFMHTGVDDPANEEMRVCFECDQVMGAA